MTVASKQNKKRGLFFLLVILNHAEKGVANLLAVGCAPLGADLQLRVARRGMQVYRCGLRVYKLWAVGKSAGHNLRAAGSTPLIQLSIEKHAKPRLRCAIAILHLM